MEREITCHKKHFISHFTDMYTFLSFPHKFVLPLRCLLFFDLSLGSSYGFFKYKHEY